MASVECVRKRRAREEEEEEEKEEEEKEVAEKHEGSEEERDKDQERWVGPLPGEAVQAKKRRGKGGIGTKSLG